MSRKRSLTLGFALLAGLPFTAFSQTASPVAVPQSTASPTSAQSTDIAADAPVITVVGLCDQGLINGDAKTPAGVTPIAPPSPTSAPAFGADCKTVITRGQFEAMFNAMDPTHSEMHRQQVAHQFPDMLVFAEKGRESGYEQQANFQEKAKHNYLLTLGQFTMTKMQDQVNQTSDAEIEKYYNAHGERFEELHVLEISLPKERKHRPAGSKPGSPDSAMARIAQSIRRDAVAGGGFDALEEKGYVLAGYTKDESPDTDLGQHWTTESLPKEYASVIQALKVGQVSEVVDAPTEYAIFKVVSKKKAPLTRARQMYSAMIMKDATQALRNSVQIQLDEKYFPKPTSGSPEPPR